MDNRVKVWWRAHGPSRRRLIQVYAALLYNVHAKGFIKGEIYTGALKNVCVPGLNCYSCPVAVAACPLGALQNALASSDYRAPWFALGIVMLFGLTFGRTICGFLCPMGLLQELLHKLPVPKLKKSRVTRVLSYFKYVILAVFVLTVPLAYAAQRFPVPAFCKYICPAGTLEGAIGLLANPANEGLFSMLGSLFTRKFVILVGILAACVFVYRAFCRFLCPLGAIYGMFARLAIVGVKVDAEKCSGCGRCVARCRMDVRRVGDHECIHCGACAEVCPAKAISMKCGKRSLSAIGRARRAAAWVIALALLIGVGAWVNRAEDVPAAPATEPSEGFEEGMRCPDFTVPLYGAGGDFTLSEKCGQVVVINFWATWCTPCVAELPYFEALQKTYPDDVSVVAIHSNLVTDDVREFLNREAYALSFAQDTDGTVMTRLGGSTQLPMTVIVDRDGTIVYNRVGSMTFDRLTALIEPLL